MTVMPRLEDLTDKSFNPFEVEKLSTGNCPDPYPRIHELMSQGSVVYESYRNQFTDVPDVQMGHLPQCMVLGYDAVMQVLTQPEIFRNKEAFAPNLGKSFGNTVTVMDAPEHTHFRKIFQKAFLPQIVAKWGETVVDPVVNRLMESFIHRGEADLIEEFTHHYPFQVIYAQVELDPEQAPVFHKLAIAQLLSSIGAPQGPEATQKLGEFFGELLRQKRAKPGTDLI
ncbi:MAG: cytochrome P450, partial [Novosphingobium sp.]|nr:cytochrome P450 [Novosphingobium sp.]